MRRTMRVATALAIAAGALTTGATAAQASGTYEGCPYGSVCVYPQDAGWNGGRPSLLYAGYGVHYLTGEVGTHRVLDNLAEGTVRVCTGVGGTGCASLSPGEWVDKDLASTATITVEP